MKQLTIFDFISDEIDENADVYPDFEILEISEIAKVISDAVGVEFKPDKYGRYTGKVGKNLIFDLGVSQYYPNVFGGKKYISVGFLDKKGQHGGGSGVDDIREAVEYYRFFINKLTTGGR